MSGNDMLAAYARIMGVSLSKPESEAAVLESIGRDVEAEINAWFAECRQQEIERASGPELEGE